MTEKYVVQYWARKGNNYQGSLRKKRFLGNSKVELAATLKSIGVELSRIRSGRNRRMMDKPVAVGNSASVFREDLDEKALFLGIHLALKERGDIVFDGIGVNEDLIHGVYEIKIVEWNRWDFVHYTEIYPVYITPTRYRLGGKERIYYQVVRVSDEELRLHPNRYSFAGYEAGGKRLVMTVAFTEGKTAKSGMRVLWFGEKVIR